MATNAPGGAAAVECESLLSLCFADQPNYSAGCVNGA